MKKTQFTAKEFTEVEMVHMDVFCVKIVEGQYKDSNKVNFSCVAKFLNTERLGIGRGDKNEGLIARLHKIEDCKRITEYEAVYDDLVKTELEDFFELRRLSGMFTPIYCIYTVNRNLLEVPIFDKTINKFVINFKITGKYFDDFGGDENLCILNLNNRKNMNQILSGAIKKIDVLKNVKVTLSKDAIKYDNLDNGRWECPEYKRFRKVDRNYELFYKDRQFDYQNEVRFMIKTDVELLKQEQLDLLIELHEPLPCYYDGNVSKLRDGLKVKVAIPICF